MSNRVVVLALFTAVVFSLVIYAAEIMQPVHYVTHRYHPYQTVDEDGRLGGPAVELVKCAANKIGHGYTIEYGNWPAMQDRAFRGEADAFFGALRTSWRDSFAELSDPIAVAHVVKVTLKGYYQTPMVRVGVKRGAGISAQLKELSLKGRVVVVEDNDDLIQALLADEADMFLMDYDVFTYQLKRMQQTEDKFTVYPMYDEMYGVYFTHKFLSTHPLYLKQFNEALEECKTQ